MKALFLLQWQRVLKEPILFLAMTLMTFAFIFAMSGFNVQNSVQVPTVFDEQLSQEEKATWLERLNEINGYSFEEVSESEATEDVALGNESLALSVEENNYKLLTLAENEQSMLLAQVVQPIFMKENRLTYVEEQTDYQGLREDIQEELASPPVAVNAQSANESAEDTGYNQQLQSLFGMSLFFAMYTIIFSLSKIATEKRTGTLDRIILSPVRKIHVYTSYMSFAFLLGFTQIALIFSVFYYFFDFELGARLPVIILIVACFVFTIVALGMLILGLVSSLEQLNAVVPIITVSMAMIGGAFWPMEAVQNEIMLTISQFIPVTYAMDALKSVSMFGEQLSDVLHSLAILLLIGVLLMGVGINLMERRTN